MHFELFPELPFSGEHLLRSEGKKEKGRRQKTNKIGLNQKCKNIEKYLLLKTNNERYFLYILQHDSYNLINNTLHHSRLSFFRIVAKGDFSKHISLEASSERNNILTIEAPFSYNKYFMPDMGSIKLRN